MSLLNNPVMITAVAVALTFVATAAAVGVLGFGFSSGGKEKSRRLEEQWRSNSGESEVKVAAKRKAQAGQLLRSLGKLLPSSPKELSRTGQMMIRAGFRPESAQGLVGAKIALCVGLASIVYVSGLYRSSPFLLIFAAVLGFLLPDFWIRRRIAARQHRIRLGLADTLDLLVISVEAGLGLDQALLRVSNELKVVHPELSRELEIVNLEMRVGKGRIDALRGLATRTGVDDIKTLVATLIQTERFGTSVAQSLRVHADTLRTKRRQRAEEQAAKTPVKLVPILVFFIFPALFVVILGPAFISLMKQMLPMLSK